MEKLLQMYILWTSIRHPMDVIWISCGHPNVQNQKSIERTMDIHVFFENMITDNPLIYLFYKQR